MSYSLLFNPLVVAHYTYLFYFLLLFFKTLLFSLAFIYTLRKIVYNLLIFGIFHIFIERQYK